jgi:hypothetical protein
MTKKLKSKKNERRNPKEMNEEKPITIKLSPEQIMEKEIHLFKTKLNLEMAEMNIKHIQQAIDANIPMKNSMVDLYNMKKQLDILNHNIIALTEQISKGEM